MGRSPADAIGWAFCRSPGEPTTWVSPTTESPVVCPERYDTKAVLGSTRNSPWLRRGVWGLSDECSLICCPGRGERG